MSRWHGWQIQSRCNAILIAYNGPMSEGPKTRRRWLTAILGLAILSFGIWWAARGVSRRPEVTGTWMREPSPGTFVTVVLRSDGTGKSIQVTSQEGIPNPQHREYHWLIQDDIISTFSAVALPWWCQDWMLDLYVMSGFDVQEQAEIVSVTEKELVVRANKSAECVVFQRVQEDCAISENLRLD
jgi:hypothetical protein